MTQTSLLAEGAPVGDGGFHRLVALTLLLTMARLVVQFFLRLVGRMLAGELANFQCAGEGAGLMIGLHQRRGEEDGQAITHDAL